MSWMSAKALEMNSFGFMSGGQDLHTDASGVVPRNEVWNFLEGSCQDIFN